MGAPAKTYSRNSRRLPHVLEVRFQSSGQEMLGQTIDVSKGGFGIMAPVKGVEERGKRGIFVLSVPGSSMKVQGSIAWFQPAANPGGSAKFGISLETPPVEWTDFIGHLFKTGSSELECPSCKARHSYRAADRIWHKVAVAVIPLHRYACRACGHHFWGRKSRRR